MGGGSSRFEETDWEIATGKLASSEQTIDGLPPTPEYGVYYIEKRSLNQRDYDITDSDSNLLYSTRMIEGTLAWFDVMGPGIDEYLLRIQVDLSRRYWVIYRFHTPSYLTQFADMTATTRLRESRGELQPCLYKKACITVTWSRYHALVNLYGPPPQDIDGDEKKNKNKHFIEVDADGPSWATPAQISTKQLEEAIAAANFDDGGAVEESKEELEPPVIQEDQEEEVKCRDEEIDEDDEEITDIKPYQEGVEESKEDERLDKLRVSPSLLDHTGSRETTPRARAQTAPNDSFHVTKEGGGDEVYRDFSHDDSSVPNFALYGNALDAKKKKPKSKIKKLKKWVADTAGANDPPPDPLEGYLQLDHVILKCEEINSFMGQHQTMLVGDSEAKLLEQEELETAAHIGADAHNPNANYRHGAAAASALGDDETYSADGDGKPGDLVNASMRERSTSDMSSTCSKDSKSFPRMRKLAKWMKTQSQKVSEASTDIATASCNGGNSSHYEELDNGTDDDDDDDDKEEEVLDPLAQTDVRRPSSTNRNEDGATAEESEKTNYSATSSDRAAQDTTNSSMRSRTSSKDLRKVSSQESIDTSASPSSTRTSSSAKQLEPLVGFWSWDNTMRVHKMKIHVAKGSDLALHIVLAIVTNQLRYERNVVVSTV